MPELVAQEPAADKIAEASLAAAAAGEEELAADTAAALVMHMKPAVAASQAQTDGRPLD